MQVYYYYYHTNPDTGSKYLAYSDDPNQDNCEYIPRIGEYVEDGGYIYRVTDVIYDRTYYPPYDCISIYCVCALPADLREYMEINEIRII